jgi:ElaB/YqjD/DUF883 family membrane-anchored ribosome-binding protein
MNEQTQPFRENLTTLADHARGLIHATSEAAEEKIVAARNRLSAAFGSGKEGLENLRGRTMDGAKTAGRAAQTHPYQTLGLALAVGTLVGMLIGRHK